MTLGDAYLIFTKGYLIFNDTKVFLDGKSQYHIEGDINYPSGNYEFVQLSRKVYLRSTPPILSDKRDLEVTICLENYPVAITNES